uniref:UBIQUITIN_CONJUGAT_2 domain-containing protein n=1 Tax=Rhabditophanes sp. KR3021 TaxID=114890 RepID=A0AC35U1M2_9BILA
MNLPFRRLDLDYEYLNSHPLPLIKVSPMLGNDAEYHFCITGSENTPFDGGYFHGKLLFPKDYPYSPPEVYFITPNGRFPFNRSINGLASKALKEEWICNPRMASILLSIQSFMNDKEKLGFNCDFTHDDEKRKYAEESLAFNLRDKIFCKCFPDVSLQIMKRLGMDKVQSIRSAASSQNSTKPVLDSNSVASSFNGKCSNPCTIVICLLVLTLILVILYYTALALGAFHSSYNY